MEPFRVVNRSRNEFNAEKKIESRGGENGNLRPET
jgi:hypothetical protein